MREAEVFKTEDGKQVAVEGFDLKAFVKKNKWKIAGGALAIGGLIFAGKKLKSGTKLNGKALPEDFGNKIKDFYKGNIRDLEKPTTDLGNIVDLWIEKDHGEDTLNTIIGDVDLNDLGFLAADIADKTFDKYPETKGMTRVDAVLTFWKPEEKATVVIEDSLEKTLEAISKIEKAKKEA